PTSSHLLLVLMRIRRSAACVIATHGYRKRVNPIPPNSTRMVRKELWLVAQALEGLAALAALTGAAFLTRSNDSTPQPVSGLAAASSNDHRVSSRRVSAVAALLTRSL